MRSFCVLVGGTDRDWATVGRILVLVIGISCLTRQMVSADPLSARLSPLIGSTASSPTSEVDWTADFKPALRTEADSGTKLLSVMPVTLISEPENSVRLILRPSQIEGYSDPVDDASASWSEADASFWRIPSRLRNQITRCTRVREWIDAELPFHGEDWHWQVMPAGLMYRSYLAGQKESRFASYLNWDRREGTLWDTALGGRLGLLRYGTCDSLRPEGWQIDIEGGTQARLDPISRSAPLLSSDFRFSFPITWAGGPWQFKTGYYHISAHLGDEYILMTPPEKLRRVNYVRDAWVLAAGYFWTERLRLYAETAYAFSVDDGAEPWEFQFGADWAPAEDTGMRGAPFAALNAHLREEVDFGGHWVVQAGWAWRRYARGSLLRTGVQFFQGKSDQYEWYDRTERRIGWGVWADF